MEEQQPRKFWHDVVLSFVPILKWPLLVFALWLVIPSGTINDFLKIARENNVKELGIGDAKVVFQEKAKVLKDANEVRNLTSDLSSLFSQTGTGLKEQTDRLKYIEDRLAKISSRTKTVIDNEAPVFVPVQNEHSINLSKDNIALFHFDIDSKDGTENFSLVVGIDEFPAKRNFDLCEATGKYKELVSTRKNKDGKTVGLKYKDKVVDCLSTIEVRRLNDEEYLYSFDINILDGFNVAKVGGYDVFLPKQSKHARSNSLYIAGSDPIVSTQSKANDIVETTRVYITGV
ncbi:TPA: hypothetical protein ACVO1K_004434 [Vibrio diabolicus]